MPAQLAAILFGFGFTVAAAYAAGRILLARLGVKLYPGEAWLVAFVTGSAVLSLLVFASAAVGAVYPAVFLALGAALILIASRMKYALAAPLPAPPASSKYLFAIVFLAYTVLYSSQAMGPEYSPDGSAYHLGYAARYLRQHGFGRITTSIYANLSQGAEMLFLFAFAFGRHSAAAMTHFAFFLALTLGILSYARRFGFPRAGVFAALLIYVSPVFGYDGTVAYNDVAAACAAFFVFYLLQVWAEERQNALLVLIGLLAGFAYAVKYPAGIAAVYAAGFVLWRSREWRRALPVCAGAALMMIPWMAKNWMVVSNPFSPFLNRWFPNPYVSVAFEQEYVRLFTHAGGYTPVERFLDVSYRGGPAAAILGAVFLLGPVAVLALRSRQGRQLLLAAAVFGAAGVFNIQTRFWLPAAPFVALAMGLALMRIPAALPSLIVAHAVLCWPTVMQRYADGGLRVRHFLPREALRLTPEESTLAYRLPGFQVAQLVERLVPPGGRVFCFGSLPEAYTSRELLIYYESTPNQAAYEMLLLPLIPDRQPVKRTIFEFAEQRVRAVRIVQTSERTGGPWSVAEVHVARNGRERIAARPNPFEIADAFDGNPVTSWKSREPLYNGMQIEVRFNEPRSIDSVAVDGPRVEYDVRLKLEAETGSGVWSEVSRQPRQVDLPAGEYRAAATRELKRRRITHLAIGPAFYGASDMKNNPAAWGLRFLGEAEATRLYAIE